MQLKEKVRYSGEQCIGFSNLLKTNSERVTEHSLGHTIFNRTENNNKLAPSIEDTIFLNIMDKEVYRDKTHCRVAPLPRHPLPNNREQALTCLTSLRQTLDRKPQINEQFVTFMGRIFEKDHAEPGKGGVLVPANLLSFIIHKSLVRSGLCLIPVRSSVVSFSTVCLTGPELNASLLGVLLRCLQSKIQQTMHPGQLQHHARQLTTSRFFFYLEIT